MKSEIFKCLYAARSGKIPVALVTRLSDGRQTIFDGKGCTGQLTLTQDSIDEITVFLKSGHSAVLSTEKNLFVRTYLPPSRIFIVGAVEVAQILARLATVAGFETFIIDINNTVVFSEGLQSVISSEFPDEVITRLAPDAGTAVVTVSEDQDTNDKVLIAALRSPAFYIGALGNKYSHLERAGRLLAQGGIVNPQRIHSPLDLTLRAVEPVEIAVAILAQIILVRNSRSIK